MIDLSTGEVLAAPAPGDAILLDNDILTYSDNKIRIQYVVSDPDLDVGDGIQDNMGVTLTASEKRGGVADLGFPDNSGGMVGAKAVAVIPHYYMIVKYVLKGYDDQVALLEKQKTRMDASIEALDGDMVLNFKMFLL